MATLKCLMNLKLEFLVLILTLGVLSSASASQDQDQNQNTIRQYADNVLSQLLRRQPDHPLRLRGESDSEPEPAAVSCSDSNPCEFGSHRVCRYGRCECPHPTEQWYYYGTRRCEVDAGRPCNPNGAVPCIRNSECVADTNSRTGYSCVCQNGLESDGYYCTNGYGRNCTASWSWDENGCNWSSGIGCRQGICRCETEGDQQYDTRKNRCAQRRGYPCMTLEIGYWECLTGLECRAKEGSTEHPLLGVCQLRQQPQQ